MFVGGLSPTTTEGKTNFNPHQEQLYDYFSTYGEVEAVKIIYNKKTKNSKGYGFVTLASERTFERIKSITHIIEGRTLDLNVGCKKSEAPEDVTNRFKRIVYVNGLPEGLSDGSVLSLSHRRKVEGFF